MKNMRETEQDTSGFPTGVANMGGAPQNLMGGGGAQVKTWEGAWGSLKCC